jgi:hypothetical protein
MADNPCFPLQSALAIAQHLTHKVQDFRFNQGRILHKPIFFYSFKSFFNYCTIKIKSLRYKAIERTLHAQSYSQRHLVVHQWRNAVDRIQSHRTRHAARF